MSTQPATTGSVLQRIFARKREEVAHAEQLVSLHGIRTLAENADAPRGFTQALQAGSGIIAEIKRASPSKGVINASLNAAETAKTYARAGASCLSVLTDEDFFQGSSQDLKDARNACTLPVLRKDFLYCEYQVYEARAWGADCILLIAAALTPTQMQDLLTQARAMQMDVLVEVHDDGELKRAANLDGLQMLGVNNRNLHTFETSLEVGERLLSRVQQLAGQGVLAIAESGISSAEDIQRLRGSGAQGFLVGEALARNNHLLQELQAD